MCSRLLISGSYTDTQNKQCSTTALSGLNVEGLSILVDFPGGFQQEGKPICFLGLKGRPQHRLTLPTSSYRPVAACSLGSGDRRWPGHQGSCRGREAEDLGLAAPVLAWALIFLVLNCREVVEIRSKIPHCTPTEVWAQGKGK